MRDICSVWQKIRGNVFGNFSYLHVHRGIETVILNLQPGVVEDIDIGLSFVGLVEVKQSEFEFVLL